VVLLPDDEIRIEYDEAIQSYYVVWRPPVAMGLGQTGTEALEELRAAAHFGIDKMVDMKLEEIRQKEGEANGEPG
jgi:predicted RNase H-like HicB family nuclease